MRVLIFGTMYCDTEAKRTLVEQWCDLHARINPSCDLLLVDSASPLQPIVGSARIDDTGNNIGHLGRGGRDGWGRAFSYGLQAASDDNYDYVVHIEADSLFRHPVIKFCEFMQAHDLPTFVCGVNGTRLREFAWIETGIMFFSVPYIDASNFIERYNWQDGASKEYPHTPEAVIYEMLDQDTALNIVPIKVMRDDKNMLTIDNVRNYDWISHTTPEIYARFVTDSMVQS